MELTEKNCRAADRIVEILLEENYTVDEALKVLKCVSWEIKKAPTKPVQKRKKFMESYQEFQEKQIDTAKYSEEVSQETAICAMRHIKAYHRQYSMGEKVDFAEPCNECALNGTCEFDWLDKLYPLSDRSNISIQLVYPASPEE